MKSETQKILLVAADVLVEGGKLEIFTPAVSGCSQQEERLSFYCDFVSLFSLSESILLSKIVTMVIVFSLNL